MEMRIPLCLPSVGVLEEQAIVAALRSGWVAPAGPQLDEFESRLAAVTGRKHAVAVSSGTAALHLALLSQGIGAGDRVAVPTLTFAATVNAVHYVGAEPVFIDCDEAGLMDTSVLEVACSEALSSERPIRAVLPVDLYGTPADYQRIVRIAETYGAVVVSDAAESLGAGTCESPPDRSGPLRRCPSTATRSSRRRPAERFCAQTWRPRNGSATSLHRRGSRCSTMSTPRWGTTTACPTSSRLWASHSSTGSGRSFRRSANTTRDMLERWLTWPAWTCSLLLTATAG